jgi:hypothetical protein
MFRLLIKNFSVPSPSATLIHVQCLLLLGLRMPVLEGRIPLAKRRIGGGREVTSSKRHSLCPLRSSLNEPVSHDWCCAGRVGAYPDRLTVPVVREGMGLAF